MFRKLFLTSLILILLSVFSPAQSEAVTGTVCAGQQVNAIISLPNGETFYFSNGGRITRLNEELLEISTITWSHGTSYHIYGAALRPDGSMIMVGSSGRWQILNNDGTLGTSGQWGHSTYDINSVAVLDNGTALMVGNFGRGQLIDVNNQLGNSFTAGLSGSSIRTVLPYSDQSFIIAGDSGRYQVVNSDGSLGTVNTWGHGTTQILTLCRLNDGSILFAGASGRYQIFSQNGTFGSALTWGHGSTAIRGSAVRSDGLIVLAGDSGRYQIFNPDLTSFGTATWPHGTSFAIRAVSTNDKGMLLLAGGNGRHQATPALLRRLIIPQATANTITLSWSNMNETNSRYYLEIAADPNFEVNRQVLLDWSTSTSCTVGSLNPDTVYYFRMKARNAIGFESFTLLEFTASTARQKTLNVDGTIYAFDVGTSADGDVVFRRNPSNPSQGQMLVNDVVVATSTTTETIRNNIFQTYASNLSVIRFDIEDVVQYLPASKTYSPGTFYTLPGTTAPDLGSVPNFRSLVVGEGVMLRSRTRALAFKVQENLVVEGILATAHGSGGAGGTSTSRDGGNGGNASGDIIIYANSISIAPNGTNASKGALMAGWGGGGGGAVTTGIPGNGGRGGSIIIYAFELTVNSEIRAGNGGGGGGAGYTTGDYRKPGGTGGQGGFLAICSGSLVSNENAVIASGYGGGGGGGSGREYYWANESTFIGAGGGGFGGGGGGSHNTTNAAGSGGSAGNPGNPFPRPEPDSGLSSYYYIGFGGSSGRDGTGNYGGSFISFYYSTPGWVSPQAGGRGGGSGGNGARGGTYNDSNYYGSPGGAGGPNGSITIRVASSLVGEPNIIVGYLSGGTGASRGAENRNIIIGQNLETKLYSAVTSNTSLKAGNDIIIQNTSSITSLEAGRDVRIKEGTVVIANIINIGRNLRIDNGTITITNGNIVGNFYFNDGTLNNTTLTIGGHAHLRGNYTGTATLSVTGDTRFLGNTNYQTDSWWTSGRTVTVNNLRVRGVMPVASPNPVGAIEVSLVDWVGKYNNPQGTMPSLAFRVERKIEDELEWTPYAPVLRSLVGSPSWTDTKTVVGKNAVYTVGFKIPDSSLGFIFVDENATAPIMSEGGGLDEVPPVINFFSVANERRSVSEPNVSVRISAQDNRTEQPNLKVQIAVNDVPYYYSGSAFVQGNGWGNYVERMEGLPIQPGENEIILRVRDESMNIGSAIRFVFYQEPGNPGALSPPPNWSLPETGCVNISTPSGSSVFAYFESRPAYFINSERAVISFSNLPQDIKFVQVSLDNVAWSEHTPVNTPFRFNVRADSLAPIFVRFANENLAAGASQELYVIYKRTKPQLKVEPVGKVTSTRNSSISVRLIITDIIDSGHQYSVNSGPWQEVPPSKVVQINLVPGYNNINIKVKDISGNIAEDNIILWRL